MTKKFMATTFLAGCLAVGWLGTPKVHAGQDDEVYFYPSHKWAVENVTQKASSGEAEVCTLSNTFNNGFKMQFAGTPDGFTNVNIDFRQPVFEKDTSYETRYTVPGQLEESIPSKAFSESLLVTDLRQQSAFSETLRSASVMDLSIKENDFRFYLTGFAAAMKDYTNCVQPENQITASLDVEETPEPEDISIVEEHADLVKKAEEEGLAPPPPEAIDLTALEQSDPQPEIQNPQPQAQETLQRPIRRERLTRELAEQLRAQKYASAADSTPKPRTTSVSIPATHVTKQTASMKVDLTNVGTESKSTDEEMITAQADIETSESVATKLQSIEPSAGAPSKGDFTDLRGKILELEKQVHQLTLENQTLDEELKITLKDAEQERLSVTSENWDLERATMRYNEAERQITRLARKLQSYKAQCMQEKNDLETMLFDPQLTNQQQLAELASLEAELEQTKSKNLMQQRKYEERIRLLEEQLNAP